MRARALVGVCLIAGLGVGWWAGQQIFAIRQVHQELAAALADTRRSVDLLRASVDTLAAASGRLFLSPTAGGVIAARNVPPAPPGQTYRVWLLLASGIFSGGAVQVDRYGRIFASIEAPPDAAQLIAVLVTQESAGGAEMTSTNMILFGRPDR